MKSLSLNRYLYIILIFFLTFNLLAEETVDIWKKKQSNNKNQEKTSLETIEKIKPNTVFENNKNFEKTTLIESSDKIEDAKDIFGIFDPAENNLDLNLWSNTNGNEIKSVFKRINNIKLSKSAESFLIDIIMTRSYLPKSNISEEDFLDLKIGWLIKNKKDNLVEEFLNKNENFPNKKVVIQYLVDNNIAKANLNNGCKKVEFINKEIKDSYLEKFKIYCLIFNNKKNEAQLIFDILKEQNLSDKFFNDKINFLLGINESSNQVIKDDNLLNFYLSSVTTKNFNYEPNTKTNKYIWEYLNAANLIKVGDVNDKKRIQDLELAANENSLNKEKIFEIYKRKSFEINVLINAEEVYQSLDGVEARALIYQKFLLSDNVENKIKLLILLKDIFKKDDLLNVYSEFMSKKLKEINKNDIPDAYKGVVAKNILSEDEFKLGKIKYNDKILHKSRVIRHYTEGDVPVKKTQKDLENIYKKIKRNKKYFFSAKDLVLVESLALDGFKIPKEIKYQEIAKKYSVPETLLKLQKNQEIGLMALKFVEIIGEDEIYNLDPETIYFITNILNQAKLIKFRNKIIVESLPSRG